MDVEPVSLQQREESTTCPKFEKKGAKHYIFT